MTTNRRLLDYHLRRLDRASTERLVVDLWRARGFDVTVEGGLIDARSAGRRDRIYVGPSADAPATVDWVVDPRGEGTGSGPVRTIDAAGLAERLTYAVEPAQRRSLCERHLGSSPEDLEPPAHWRARRRLESIRPAGPVLVIVATLVLVAATMATAPAAVDTDPVVETSQPVDVSSERLGDAGSLDAVGVPAPSYPSGPPGDILNESHRIGNGTVVADGAA